MPVDVVARPLQQRREVNEVNDTLLDMPEEKVGVCASSRLGSCCRWTMWFQLQMDMKCLQRLHSLLVSFVLCQLPLELPRTPERAQVEDKSSLSPALNSDEA